ncbi:hypothetical protein EV144_1011441 [Flavobacterium sp. 270]|nr:hypothetical protein EV144_1011441 [Flavobacterium sp. 270]
MRVANVFLLKKRATRIVVMKGYFSHQILKLYYEKIIQKIEIRT